MNRTPSTTWLVHSVIIHNIYYQPKIVVRRWYLGLGVKTASADILHTTGDDVGGTPRTISILLDQVQDLVATLKTRTGGGTINLVTAPEYGADPTGVVDSTAAFAAALAGPATAIVPPGVYRLSNLVMPSGSSLVGYSALGYGKGTGLSVATTLVALNASAVRVINVDGASNVLIAGVRIDCDPTRSETRNVNCDGISAGGKDVTLRDVTVRLGRYGLGGAVSSGTNIAA